jgi:hypothetical protein
VVGAPDLKVSGSAKQKARLLYLCRAGARYAAVVRALVVLSARRAGVVRAPVVLSARRAQPTLVWAVVRIRAGCAACGPMRSVTQMTGSSCRVVHCWCDRRMRSVLERGLPVAQQGAVADAATRPRDRSFFGSCFPPDCIPDLSVRRS